MRHRTVADLMTPEAVVVQRGTLFKEIARLLDEYDITAVPVLDENDQPVGVVSEADLLRRQIAKLGATTAEAIMTSPCRGGTPRVERRRSGQDDGEEEGQAAARGRRLRTAHRGDQPQ